MSAELWLDLQSDYDLRLATRRSRLLCASFKPAPLCRLCVRNDERYVKHGDWGRLYAVVATDGTITTVGHRYKRIPLP